ncbi:putative gustatory receptor 47b [Drosophila eugracilis]|uniref:putative gustatory receptor 47b n=1 Tax=Drosophila eugracilis TaxID=29029 RepID=UPI0007E8ADEA|nr:putative gustatory receptor 47b [Drosophila eugracilis]
MERNDGFVYCYGNLFGLMFYWGLTTIRVRSSGRGGSVSNRWTVGYALLARLFMVTGFLGSVMTKLKDTEMAAAMFGHLSPLVKAIFTWECLSCSITYLEFCLSLDIKRSRHLKLLVSMQEFDEGILEVFPHVQWSYQRSRLKYWYGTVIVGFCFFSFSISLIFDTARCTCGIPSTLLMAVTYTLLTSSVGLVGFVHIGIMDFLRVRLRLVQQLVLQLYQSDGDPEVHEKITYLFNMSKRCSYFLTELNGVYGFAAAAGIFYDFTIMTCFVYVICQKLLNREPWDLEYTFTLLHVTIHTYKVIITSTYGYLLQREKRNCMHLLSRYSKYFPGHDVALRQTEDLQHWRMHNRQAAMVGTTIKLNVSTIYLVYNGMANYVIILVQLLFQQQQINDRQLASGKDVDIVGPMGPITHMD